jgi:hypothetical protein
MDLGPITSVLRLGTEPFLDGEEPLGFDLLSFWQWGVSDVVNNVTRGILAEYLVAKAVDATDGVRDAWAAYDIDDPRGIKIEVKSSAYIQSWGQKELSKVSFSYKRSIRWNSVTGDYDKIAKRHADVYVFALLVHKDKPTINPMDLSQWCFYVVPTSVLNARERSQDSITLASLNTLAPHNKPVKYRELRDAIAKAADLN